MTPEETSLARLLVALPGFKCTSGLLVRSGFRAIRIQCEPIEGATARTPDEALRLIQYLGAVPDLHDPATAGILLGMLPRRHLSARDWDVYEVTVYDCPPLAGSVVHSGPHGTAKWWTVSGGSLGVAAARALVAIGRAS